MSAEAIQALADEIVEGLLDTVEAAGHFLVNGRERRLLLKDIVARDREPVPAAARMKRWAAGKIAESLGVRLP